MASKQGSSLIHVPLRFSIVEPGVYRSASPTASQVPFLTALGLRTIVSLTCEHPIRPLVEYARANGVEFVHLGSTLFQPLTDWRPITDEVVKAALEIILDVRSHPVLVIDPLGIHQTGVVFGCLRAMQGWNFASTLSEYRSHSGPTKYRYADESYIELFDPDLINLPPSQCLPSWWGEPDDDFDDEWVEEDKPKKEKKDKKDKKDKDKKEEKAEGDGQGGQEDKDKTDKKGEGDLKGREADRDKTVEKAEGHGKGEQGDKVKKEKKAEGDVQGGQGDKGAGKKPAVEKIIVKSVGVRKDVGRDPNGAAGKVK